MHLNMLHLNQICATGGTEKSAYKVTFSTNCSNTVREVVMVATDCYLAFHSHVNFEVAKHNEARHFQHLSPTLNKRRKHKYSIKKL